MVDEWDILLRVVGSAVLGAAVGYDRQMADKPAGVRTHMLVGAGAALFVGVGVLLAESVEALGAQAARTDVSRITAGVVAGVGFLGAGAIIVRADRVTGLTTAAGIWVVAAVGVAVGFGFWWLGVLSTALILLIHLGSYEVDRRRPPDPSNPSADD